MEDRVSIGRSKTPSDIVPEAPSMQPEKTTYVMQVALSAPMPSYPYKKAATLTEIWELQKLALCRLFNAISLESLPKIWRTLAPLKKEMARASLKIACQNKERYIRYKAPCIIQVETRLTLILSFHTEDPDVVEDTVNIFLFPHLYISSGSEAALVESWWNTALDSSTLTTYADNALLIQHQKVDTIIGWEAAVNVLEQWLVLLMVILVLGISQPEVYELTMLMDAS